MARLIVKSEDGTETVELRPGEAVGLGRDPDNQIALPSARGASRKHCRITSIQSGGNLAWELTDLGATNTTRVNGKSAEKKVLASGDVIAVGTAEITFEDPAEEERLKEAGSKGVCFLEWVTGDHRGDKVWLEASRVTLGRRTSNTIALDDRMSSGHHAEITKDLNGYTIRDMGSTNGTLVNGEPTTEAALTHGTRVRIGNSRFVFKDPSMKDIEIELSQFEEDEGWGMMGDIDLSRARGSYGGLMVGLLLLGAVAFGGWYLMQQADEEAGPGGGTDVSDLIVNGDMEDVELVEFYWVPPSEGSKVRISSVKRGKGHALSLRHTGGEEHKQPVLVSYVGEFPVLANEALRVRANLRASGDAVLVAVLRNWSEPGEGDADAPAAPAPVTGAPRLTHTVTLGTGQIDRTGTRPPWAESVLVGVLLGPGSSAVLDDVSVSRVAGGGEPRLEVDCPGDPEAWINPTGGLDIATGLTVLVVGAGPVVKLSDGTVLSDFVPGGIAEGEGAGPFTLKGHYAHGEDKVSATIRWSRTENDEGLHAEVECAQAEAVGLSALLLRTHVGVALNVLTADGPGNIQAAAGETLKAVRKTLGGNPNPRPGRPRTLVTFAPNGAPASNSLELHDTVDASLLDIRHFTAGSSASFDMVTNYEIQSRAAQEALNESERLVRTEPGRGMEALREVAVLYPFIERVRDRANSLLRDAEKSSRAEIASYRRSLEAFKIFRSGDTLAVLDRKAEAVKLRFPQRGAANGQFENDVAEIAAQAAEARLAYYAENAGSELTRLERLADLLADVDGYEPMAAIFYRTIVDRFGHLESNDSFGRRVKRARERYDELRKEHSSAIPQLPK